MEVINGGTIVYPKGSNYLDLLFQDIKSIKRIAVLLNGNMRTPKINALHRLIDWLNIKSTDGFKLSKLSLDNSSLGSNPWLSGFIEADGNFYCEFKLNSKGIATLIKDYMRISQKQSYKSTISNDNSNFYIMDKIREFLNVKNVTKIKRNKPNYIELSYEVRTTKKLSCDILINYLTKFSLFSSKNLDFLNWSEVHQLRISRQYKYLDGTSKLISLKNSMNTKRTQFNWDSLNKFYC
jgi:LAGLIDADG endonuclease